jgi:hypothetical protein
MKFFITNNTHFKKNNCYLESGLVAHSGAFEAQPGAVWRLRMEHRRLAQLYRKFTLSEIWIVILEKHWRLHPRVRLTLEQLVQWGTVTKQSFANATSNIILDWQKIFKKNVGMAISYILSRFMKIGFCI